MSIQPQIDYTDVEAIPYQKTLSFVNNFIIKTTEFINRFSFLCEEKLTSVSRQLQRLEITMSLLEAKLTSIDDVPGGPSTTSTTSTTTTGQPITATGGEDVALAPLQPPPVPPPGPGGQPTPGVEEVSNGTQQDQATAGPPTKTVSEDSRYTRYFKMLKMGVPLAHVQSKMMMEGHDPAILENPNAASDAPPDERSDSLSSESDDEEWDEHE